MVDTKKIVTLKSSDGEVFDVEEVVALESETIKHMIEDDYADNGIPLPNVTSKIMSLVVQYCKKYVETPQGDDRAADDELKKWDADFINDVDQNLVLSCFGGKLSEHQGLVRPDLPNSC
ncbi:hypothetical protein MKW98_018885 [Papaver atlanticum]|uniref:SKP1 component POZ domain-containing protein n=1 Tax=Papaver atlanticum TaxID=357466 RepID=A0AAD4XXV7_9MAGN|nr:hypothetical protein MKW98_018885 [Papaver atlanticum]